jgi:hypothetical protein
MRGYWKLKEEILVAICGELTSKEAMDVITLLNE